MKRILLLNILVLFAVVTSQAQSALERKIAKLEAQGHYVEAAELHISQHDDGEREASIKAGMALYKLGKYKESLYYFQHADSMGTLDHADEVMGLFQALKAHLRYKDADDLIATHMDKLKDPAGIKVHDEQLRNYEKFLSYKNARISTVPINTKYSEFGPSVLNGWLYFESTRLADNNKEAHGLNDQPFYNLYAHPLGDPTAKVLQPKGNWDKPQVEIASGKYKTLSVPADINQGHHDAPVFLSPEGKHLFYTTNWDHEGKDEVVNPYLNLSYSTSALENSQKIEVAKIHLNIYYSTNSGNVWSAPVPFPYNNDAWSNQHAFFHEQTGTLYYSSNMPGGQGGFDIWKSTLVGNQWTAPENLGANVNTPRNEVFPVLSPEGILLFSSNGWPNLGGMDIFLVDDPALPPLNLLAGMNTEMDDFGMNFYAPGKGYFVSNRKESVGDDDIFEFEINLSDIIDFHRPSYQVFLKDEASGEAIAGEVTIVENGASKTLKVGKEGVRVKLSGHQAEFNGTAPEYKPGKTSLNGATSSRELVVRLAAIPKKQELEYLPLLVQNTGSAKDSPSELVEAKVGPIYFHFNKYNIRKDAVKELKKVVEFLGQYKDTRVLLTGHTDTRGSLGYNDELSRNRVEQAKSWLESKGISTDRILVEYRGENQPSILCSDSRKSGNPDKCLNEKQHQLNRRVEIALQQLR